MTDMMYTEPLSPGICMKETRKRDIFISTTAMAELMEEKQEIKQKIRRLKEYLDKCVGKECTAFGPEIRKYFYLHFEKDGKTLKLAEENTKEVEKDLSPCRIFCHRIIG